MTDDKINEIYVMAEFAKRAGQTKIPVHIFPFEMTEENIKNEESKHQGFWQNLKGGYDYFEEYKTTPTVKVNSAGEYLW